MTDLITEAQTKIKALRYLLREVKRLEAKERDARFRALEKRDADMARYRLRTFMHKHCGWPEPAPVVSDENLCAKQMQDDYVAVLLSIPMPKAPVSNVHPTIAAALAPFAPMDRAA